MESLQPPSICEDGDHVFPVTAVRGPAGGPHENSRGEVRWNHREGVSFRFELPAKTMSEVFTPLRAPTGGSGSMHSISPHPEWAATLANGTDILLFGAIERQTGRMTSGTGGSSSGRTVRGRAAYAKVTLGRDEAFSFWNDTGVTDRLYFLGLEMYPWPEDETVEWQRGERSGSFSRTWMSLNPSLKLVSAQQSPPDEKAVWLTYTTDGKANEFWFDKPCEDAKGFVSLLVGRATPFLWKDTFTDDDHLTRLYMMGHGRRHPITGGEQPFPLGRSTEMFKHGRDIIRQLPAMFARFVELRASYDAEWIASPIWYAYDSYVDDQLALACVSLERLATAHGSCRKKSDSASKAKPFLDPVAFDALRNAMTAALETVATAHKLTEDVKTIITRKIGSMNQPPNVDKLSAVFDDVGIVLTDTEKQVLNNRNRSLHGSRTMGDANQTNAVAEEVLRFDTMRTLINRALLTILGYSGPYTDYSARPEKGNFPMGLIVQPESPAVTTGE
jgi:hypothetical protein